MRVLELFCGIGGAAAAVDGRAEVVAAVDINRQALGVYARNFPHPVLARTIESLSARELARLGADLWWMSPPCQPFTWRGLRRDDRDPRSQGLLALIDRLSEVRPPAVALENVPGFPGSRTHARLCEALAHGGYAVSERLLCPTELGIPNRRLRFYLLASRDGLGPAPGFIAEATPLAAYFDAEPDPALAVDPALARRYEGALDVVDPQDPRAVTACFTSAYAHSPVRSGSYLKTPSGLRRFSPTEILRLLGFPPSFTLPPDLPLAAAWRLLGNSVSVAAVREVLRPLLGDPPGSAPA